MDLTATRGHQQRLTCSRSDQPKLIGLRVSLPALQCVCVCLYEGFVCPSAGMCVVGGDLCAREECVHGKVGGSHVYLSEQVVVTAHSR